MRKLKAVLSIAIMAATALVQGCADDPKSFNDLRLEKNAIGLEVGQKTKVQGFYVTVQDGVEVSKVDVTNKLTWKVENGPADGATISSNGIFTASKSGKYVVGAVYGKASNSTPIIVHESKSKIDENVKNGDVNKKDSSGKDTSFYEDKGNPPVDPSKLERIFLSGNDFGTKNGGRPVSFTLDRNRRVIEIWTYHYNMGKGTPGGGSITLSGPEGDVNLKVTRTQEGQGSVPNAYWIASTDLKLKPGKYTISDSDPSTWSTNAQTGGLGHAWVMAEKE